jgi:hypothetical protein
MTRRSNAAFLALSVALGFLLAASPAVAGGPACSKAFAKRVAGSYLMNVTVEGFPPLMVLATLGADGTTNSNDVTDYGVVAGGYESDNRGTWRRSGWREVTFNSIGFVFGPDGAFIGFGRLRGTTTFEKGFAAFSAVGVHEYFFDPGQDPLDPAAVPSLPPLQWTATGRLIPPSVE